MLGHSRVQAQSEGLNGADVEGNPGILDVVTGQVLWTLVTLASPPEAAVEVALLPLLPEILQPGVERMERVRLANKYMDILFNRTMH